VFNCRCIAFAVGLVVLGAPLRDPPRYILRLLEMASPNLDIEAQANSLTEHQPAIVPDPLPPLPTNTANTQLPNTAMPEPQATNTNENHNGNAPAQQTADNSQVQRGIDFPLSPVAISFVYQTRTTETLLMGSGRFTSLRLRSRTRR
jgi:hypothetical protein